MTTQAVLTDSRFVVTTWQPGTSYSPGAVVQPTTQNQPVTATSQSPTNASFTASLTGWTATGSVTWSASGYDIATGAAAVAAGASNQSVTNTNQVAVTVGQAINAYCFMGGNALIGPADNVTGFARLVWYDASHAQIGTSDGTATNLAGSWQKVTVSGTAPSGAAYCAVAGVLTNPSAQIAYIDNFFWDYIPPAPSATQNKSQYFTSISSSIATSGASEPDWSNGGTYSGNVVDGGITWARGLQESIQWIGTPFCLSGSVEPTWGTVVNAATPDGSGNSAFDWLARTPQVLDTNCPQSKFVVAGASKILAGNGDIVNFSATLNPIDWTSEDDAGFLPTGLQSYGANSVAAMGLYRSNLVVFNSQGFQMWQLDEDPANMALLDAIPIGSTYHKALASVSDDLFFLSAQGVRTIGISAGSGSLAAGDVGMPVDPIVQPAIAYAKTNNVDPLAVYYPSYGQYWIVFPGFNAANYFLPIATAGAYTTGDSVFVYTMSRKGEVGAWSRYVLPFRIDGFCFANDDLCIRSGDDLLKVDPTALQDYASDTYNGTSRATYFPGAVQWPYLDFGQTGLTKKFDTMDIACSENTAVTVQIGYDQTNLSALTTAFTMPGDSIPGMQVPIPILAPSISIRLTFTSSDNWQVDAVNVYLQDQAITS